MHYALSRGSGVHQRRLDRARAGDAWRSRTRPLLAPHLPASAETARHRGRPLVPPRRPLASECARRRRWPPALAVARCGESDAVCAWPLWAVALLALSSRCAYKRDCGRYCPKLYSSCAVARCPAQALHTADVSVDLVDERAELLAPMGPRVSAAAEALLRGAHVCARGTACPVMRVRRARRGCAGGRARRGRSCGRSCAQ